MLGSWHGHIGLRYGDAAGTAGVVTEANRYEDVDIAEVDDEPNIPLRT